MAGVRQPLVLRMPDNRPLSVSRRAVMPEAFQPALDELREAIVMACETTYAPRMLWGRMQAMAMPRVWVLENIERVAAEALPQFDYWNYRRLLELYSMLDPDLVARLVDRGLSSADFEVREAAEDFSDPVEAMAVGRRFRDGIARLDPQALKSLAVRRKRSDDRG